MKNIIPTFAQRPARSGFTLIELLTVIAIIGILAAILIPTVGAVRAQARITTSTSNLKQIVLAANTYVADNRGYLPGGYYQSPTDSSAGNQWTGQLLPYISVKGNTTAEVYRANLYIEPVLASLAGVPLQPFRGGYGMNERMSFADGRLPSGAGGKVDNNLYMQPITRYANPGRTVIFAFSGRETFLPDATTGLIPPQQFYTPNSGYTAPSGTVEAQKRIGANSDGIGGHSALYAFLDGSVRKLTQEQGSEYLKRRQ